MSHNLFSYVSYFSHAENKKRVEQMAMTDEDSSQHFRQKGHLNLNELVT